MLIFLVFAGFSSAFDMQVYWSYRGTLRPAAPPMSYGRGILFPEGEKLALLDSKGGIVWEFTCKSQIKTLAYTEYILVGTLDSVVALDEAGNMLWTSVVGHQVDYIIDVEYPGHSGFLVAGGKTVSFVDYAGVKSWSYQLPWAINAKPVFFGSEEPKALISAGGFMYSLNLPPYKESSYSLEGTIVPDPLVLDSNVVFASSAGKLYFLNAETLKAEQVVGLGSEAIFGPYEIRGQDRTILEVITRDGIVGLNMTGAAMGRYTLAGTVSSASLFPYNENDYVLTAYGNILYLLDGFNIVWSKKLDNPVIYVGHAQGSAGPLLVAVTSDSTLHVFSRQDEVTDGLGDEYLSRAMMYQNAGDTFNVAAYAELSRDLYDSANDTEGSSNANGFLDRLRADEQFQIGKVYMDYGYYNISERYLRNASEEYARLGFPDGVAAVNELLLKRPRMEENADMLLDRAKEDYMLRNLELSKDFALEAYSVYSLLNSTEGMYESRNLGEKAIARSKADYYYRQAVRSYFNDTLPETAAEYLNKSGAIYAEVGDGRGVDQTRELMMRIQADGYLGKSRSLAESGDEDGSAEYARQAQRLYSEIGYDIGVSKAGELIPAEPERTPSRLPYLLAVVLGIVLLAGVYLRIRT